MNFLTPEYIFFVEHPKLGLTNKVLYLGHFVNFLIWLFDFKIELEKFIPNITSDPIELHSFSIFIFVSFIIFFFIKKFNIAAAFMDPPPSPASCGIFFFNTYFEFFIF